MPLFKKTKPFTYEMLRQGEDIIIRINLEQFPNIPSLELNPIIMSRTIDILAEAGNATKIIFYQRRDYEYSYEQTLMLLEIAKIQNNFVKQKILSYYNIEDQRVYAELQDLIFNLLKSDPIGAYVKLKRILRREEIRAEKEIKNKKTLSLLRNLINTLEKTRLIKAAKTYIAGYKIGDRSAYEKIFSVEIKPDFMFSKLMASYPPEGEELETYSVGDTEITIFSLPDTIQYLYHITPPEFKLSEEKYEILDQARNIMAEHKPTKEEFTDPKRIRQVFFNVGRDLIEELTSNKGYRFREKEIDELTNILIRYTVGFGLIEVLLQDEKIQDITINSPMGRIPMFIVHQDYTDCKTNIYPTIIDAESWASKLRMISGRPLDEANPILDTGLEIPGAYARVAVITAPLNPYGLAYAFRRHRDMPWTLPLFIKNRMIDPLSAGLLSFIVDGSRTMLIAGTRSAGKTSLLGSILTEIMRKYRLITIEDSVTGDCELFIRKNGKVERTSIGNLIDNMISKYGYWYNLTGHEILGNDENIEILSMDKKKEIKWSRISKMIRHKVKKPIYEVITRTGRKIKVTEDHSLFSLGENAEINEIKGKDIKEDSFIAVPRNIPSQLKSIKSINILENLDLIDKGYLSGEWLKIIFDKYSEEIKQLSKEYRHNRSLKAMWFRKKILPIKIIKDLHCLNYDITINNTLFFKYSDNSKAIPTKIELDKNFLTFVGLWIADGCYDKTSVILSVVEEENREIFRKLAQKYGFKVKLHSDGFSLMINSITLKKFMKDILKLRGNAYTKRIPDWIFNLSKEQISFVLKGIFSGDGCVSDKEIVIPLASKNLLKDIQSLLLQFNIIFRIGKKRKDKTYNASISALKSLKIFKKYIDILPNYKENRLEILCCKKSTHDKSDIIPLTLNDKKQMKAMVSNFRYQDYVIRNNNIGREKLGVLLEQIPSNTFVDNLNILQKSDLFWDQVKSINVMEDYDSHVYDLSVPDCENFICENVIAHNTLELPTASLRRLGYNIQPMKVAAALTKGTAEVPADEGIRTTLRMGDSALIVGEIRSLEARALYEAMRIGAMANVVAGTIHGDSPYGVFDRVVNDLNVPKTSFKATDLVVVANPVRSADGLHRWRRVTQITEVRKHWTDDPLLEKGFVDLMKYDSNKDMLMPSSDLINGESDVLKAIAGNVKEWASSWDAVWDNVMLRANIKKLLVEHSIKSKMPKLLEAKFTIQSNDEFHRISDRIAEETGFTDPKRILFDWKEWLKRKIKERKIEVE